MVLLITCTACPNPNVYQLKLTNKNERIRQYKECLRYYINCSYIHKIVLCDNSNVHREIFEQEIQLAKMKKKELEVMAFQGDTDEVLKLGKGYGEGEIVSYALKNSSLLAGDNYFIKLTGRLIFLNIDQIVRKLDISNGTVYINNSIGTNCIDSRIYGMPIEKYEAIFMDAYKNVDDKKGKYLEKVLFDRILEYKLSTRNFPKYSRIKGIAGSSGYIYVDTTLKRKIRLFIMDLLCYFNYYTVKIN